jgi:hypothetical protein
MSIRDYGYGETQVDGVPEIVGEAPGSCPNCNCEKLFLLKVKVLAIPSLRGGEGFGTYAGCPACPWASPMVAVSSKVVGA